jgi:hypothetical protein
MEISNGLDLQLGTIEPRAEPNLTGQWPRGIIARRRYGALCGVPPFWDATIVAEPLAMLGRIVAFETNNCRDKADAIGRLRITAKEVVLRQRSDHAVATEEERQRLNDRGLAAVVWAHEHGVWLEMNTASLNAAEVFDAQIGYPHCGCSRNVPRC